MKWLSSFCPILTGVDPLYFLLPICIPKRTDSDLIAKFRIVDQQLEIGTEVGEVTVFVRFQLLLDSRQVDGRLYNVVVFGVGSGIFRLM